MGSTNLASQLATGFPILENFLQVFSKNANGDDSVKPYPKSEK
jgi:hypothetical protein